MQVWIHFRWNWVCKIMFGHCSKVISCTKIRIFLINRDLKSWKVRCRDICCPIWWQSLVIPLLWEEGRRAHLAVSHTRINWKEVLWSQCIHCDLYWYDWKHSLTLWICRTINASPKCAFGFVINFFFFCRRIAWKERDEIWRNCFLAPFLGLICHIYLYLGRAHHLDM